MVAYQLHDSLSGRYQLCLPFQVQGAARPVKLGILSCLLSTMSLSLSLYSLHPQSRRLFFSSSYWLFFCFKSQTSSHHLTQNPIVFYKYFV